MSERHQKQPRYRQSNNGTAKLLAQWLGVAQKELLENLLISF